MAQTTDKVFFLCPGQGSQSVGMGKTYLEEFPESFEVFEEASDALGFNMQRLCFEDPENQLGLTEYTQPALLTVSFAAGRILQRRAGIVPFVAAGHSLGEYSALALSNYFSFSDALKAVRFRGICMQKAVPVGAGSMAAYMGSQVEQLKEICAFAKANIPKNEGNVCEIVNYNSPSQFVLSGHAIAVKFVCEKVAEKKLGKCIPLKVSAPFHSSLMGPAAQEMAGYLEGVAVQKTSNAIVANVDGNIYESNYERNLLVSQINSPVYWTQSMQKIEHICAAKELENTSWIEIGAGTVLQNLGKKIFAERANSNLKPFEFFGTNEASQIVLLLEKIGA